MSATEDDTELRDLLVQNLENSGVLNKLKAEMRAAVFLAMEEQDRLENKNPLINENLKKCLNSRDGRLVAGLIVDFLQVFNLDFSLAVFQPEINSLSSLDCRDLVCRDLGLSESEVNRNCPLLLELVRRGRHKPTEEPTQKQISLARKKFDFYDKDGNGSVGREDLKNVFTDLFPSLNQNMLEHFITDELRAADQSFSSTIDFHVFVGFYTRLFSQCRAVVVQDSDGVDPEEKIRSSSIRKDRSPSESPERCRVDLDLEVEEDPEDGDSFFDDPLPKPQKTYSRLSVLAAEDRPSELRKVEVSGARGSPAGSLSEGGGAGGEGAGAGGEGRGRGGGTGGGAAAVGGEAGGGEAGGSSASEQSHSRKGAPASREKGFRDPKAPNDKTLDDDVEYDDDFNSHRSDLSRSEFSIGEEIEEVSIEGPDTSDKDDSTQDLSISQLSRSHGADYMEEVA
ncbi:centrosomal protein 43 isoform X2 [Clinocottus analis]|uniref:centrosomal protein 43 isoform X2 n=1 Tax=Clinocottus analis TaxID=304258 RepID=UPI0035C0DA5D